MSSHLFQAQQLKSDYQNQTKEYSVLEVMQLWEAYSSGFAAGWLTPDIDRVENVFGRKISE